MEKGRYKGFFQYYYEQYRISSGFEKTYFIIEVTEFDGHKFSGWIEDDMATGGMEGRGEVSGAIYSNGILFVKQMPFMGLLVKDNVTGQYQSRIDRTRKHMPIYYDGVEGGEDNYSGTWNFKYSILIHIILWLKGIKTGGTWEMHKEQEIKLT
jgi:hypothetical protein